jgi:hypothetical protein
VRGQETHRAAGKSGATGFGPEFVGSTKAQSTGVKKLLREQRRNATVT